MVAIGETIRLPFGGYVSAPWFPWAIFVSFREGIIGQFFCQTFLHGLRSPMGCFCQTFQSPMASEKMFSDWKKLETKSLPKSLVPPCYSAVKGILPNTPIARSTTSGNPSVDTTTWICLFDAWKKTKKYYPKWWCV